MSFISAKIKENWQTFIIALLLIAGIWFRLSLYGDPRLSIGMNDTESYINSANAPLFSWKLFADQRLFTTNLLYKLANNTQECKLTDISLPTKGSVREVQPCFDKIALLQNLLSILGWCLLAWTTSRWLKNPLAKILSVILILAFAFTPQIAEWDSILSSESLSLSLFVGSFALLQEVAFRVLYRSESLNSTPNIVLISGWMIVFTLWVFIRDAHLYVIPITILFLSVLLFIKKFRQTKIPVVIIAILFGIFVLGYVSAKDSLRATHYPLQHAFEAYIFPFPARVQFFENLGMPNQQSPAFQNWFDAQGTKTYGVFLITHPRFVISTLFNQSFYFNSDSLQPYYNLSSELSVRNTSDQIGKLFHPESNSVYLLDTVMLISLGIASFKHRDPWITSWIWLALWVFLCASITLFTNFFGDTIGAARHVFPPVELFRLSLWIFLMIHIDYLLEK
ncbi:MAG TPA: hypothetical protein VIN60_09440 [Anaerolineales bacterium]